MPLSIVPSQLLSMPSQTSPCGLLLQVLKPPPTTQVPTGTATGALQVRVPTQLGGLARPQGRVPTPLSVKPSQSLSQPSQISAEGTQPLHTASSICPSQLSSTA